MIVTAALSCSSYFMRAFPRLSNRMWWEQDLRWPHLILELRPVFTCHFDSVWLQFSPTWNEESRGSHQSCCCTHQAIIMHSEWRHHGWKYKLLQLPFNSLFYDASCWEKIWESTHCRSEQSWTGIKNDPGLLSHRPTIVGWIQANPAPVHNTTT